MNAFVRQPFGFAAAPTCSGASTVLRQRALGEVGSGVNSELRNPV